MNSTVCQPYARRSRNNRQAVEVELSPDVVDIEIDYHSPKTGSTNRRIRPIALRLLAEGEVALIAQCRLRDEYRTFAFDRISSVSFPGFSSKVMTGAELSRLFLPDMHRLFAHELTVNGPVPAAPYNDGTLYDPRTAGAINLDHSTVEAPHSDCPKITAAVTGICNQMLSYMDDISNDAPKPGFSMTVTLLKEVDNTHEVFIDVPAWVAVQGREGSSHARVAYLLRRQGVTQAARGLLAALNATPGALHDRSSVRVSASRTNRQDKSIFLISIDDILISPKKLAASTLGQRLQKRLTGMPQIQSGDLPLWMLETDAGIVRIRASTPEMAVRRITSLSERSLRVFAMGQQVELPAPFSLRESKAA